MTLDNLKTHRGVLLGLALTAMILIAYWPAIRSGGFIWDDEAYVIHNETLRDADGLVDIWTNPRATPQYYPLVHTTYWLEYRLWKLDPTGYHVTNVWLHALAALLLWRVLRGLQLPGAWLAAALFAVHPVHVESVAWITERKNVLSGVFYLWSALAYLKWDEAARLRGAARLPGYLLAFLLYGCALLSKTVTASLPAALVLVLWWKDGFASGSEPGKSRSFIRQAWRRTWPLAPFFVVGLALSCLTIWLEIHHVGAKGEAWDFTVTDRCLIAGRAIWFYAAKLAWPKELIFNYPRWEIDAAVWWQVLYPLSVAAVVVALWTARKRIGRGPLTAVLFFAGTLVPALGFFDVYPMRYSFVADHFQYHASMGLLALVAAILTRGWRRLTAGSRLLAGPLARVLPTAALLLLLGALSWKQCHIYQGLETLWQDTIKKNPASWQAYTNLGILYINQGRPADAIPVLEQAARYNPFEVKIVSNIGVALSALGQLEEAIAQYQKAIDMDPDDPVAYGNIGVAMAEKEHYEKAVSYYLKALAINPDLGTAHSNIGKVLVEMGRIEEAIQHHEKAVELMPDQGEIHLNYGEALHVAGHLRLAEEQYRAAVSLDPSLAAAHINLGLIAANDQLLPAALSHFRRAVEEGPDVPDAHRGLAKTLSAMGQTTEAKQHFDIAVELDPSSIKTRMAYGQFLLDQGDEAAEGHFRKVLHHEPEHVPALNLLAVLLASQGKNREAVDLLRRAVKLAPDDAELHNNLGVILVRLGEHKEALASLEKAVRLKSDYHEARKNLDDLRRLMASKEGPS